MEGSSTRVAQVFVWKQGTAPDVDYARQVLSVVNPEAFKAISGDNPPLKLFSVMDGWPEDPWARALRDMRAIPAPDGTQWTDTSRYDLTGWQGTDSRTGDKIFIVTARYRTAPVTSETFRGEDVQAPPYIPPAPVQAQVQTPYYQQYPTGPLAWPQQPQQPQQLQGYGYPQYAQPQPQPPAQGGYPYGYNPLITGPLAMTTGVLSPSAVGGSPAQPEPASIMTPDSYAPFYVGFGPRLLASLIDFFFMVWFFAAAVGLSLLLWAGLSEQPGDFLNWLRSYSLAYIGLGVFIFLVYHVVGWSASGRTWGKKLMGMRVVSADGGAPGFGRSLLRMLGYVFSLSIAGWGFLMIALTAKRQGLHDKIAETYVVPDRPTVPAPAGLPGYRVVPGALQAPAQPVMVPVLPAMGMPVGVQPQPQPYSVVQVQVAPVAPTSSEATPQALSPSPQEEPITPPQVVQETQPAQEANGKNGVVVQGRTTEESVSIVPQESPMEPEEQAEPIITPNIPSSPLVTGPLMSGPLGQSTEAVLAQAARERPERPSDMDRARALFRAGMESLERGSRRGYTGMEVEPEAARAAAAAFHDALELVPNAVAYRYFYAVALRYSEGFEVAIGEFRQVLELDPGHFEARQQVAFGPRWHDAFAYPPWSGRAVEAAMPLPEPVRSLLPQPHRPGTRLVLLRETSNKMVVALSRTRRDTWTELPTPDMPARIELVLSRTPAGPIIAFYVVVRDDPLNPYKGETFLNPHDPGQPSDDACQLGQHMMAQLARQDHTYLIFVDESDNLLMSRKLVFDTTTQVNIARVHYEAQSLPPQVMDASRFQQAAQWHMEHFSLDQIKV